MHLQFFYLVKEHIMAIINLPPATLKVYYHNYYYDEFKEAMQELGC